MNKEEIIELLKDDVKRLSKNFTYYNHTTSSVFCVHCGGMIEASPYLGLNVDGHKQDCPIVLHTRLMNDMLKYD
jgi:hypothetical protein